MTPVKDLIKRVRTLIHDNDCINYDDRDILHTLNAGLRFMRRTISEIQPELLMTTYTGILQAGEDTIELQHRPMKIIEMTAGDKIISSVENFAGKKIFSNFDKVFGNTTRSYSKYELKTFNEYPLEETTLHHIRNRNKIGQPEKFYRVGLQSLKIYPKPRAETAYTLRTIDDIDELRFHDVTPILNEFDDFLIEYATLRLSLEDEFDMTQETQLMANIQQQIAQVLSPPPSGTIVRGYW